MSTHIPSWWSASIKRWFEVQLSTSMPRADRDRLIRLATDTRMERVAKRLAHEEKTLRQRDDFLVDPAVTIMHRAWQARNIWPAIKNQTPRANKRELSALARECQKLRERIERMRWEARLLLLSFGEGLLKSTKRRVEIADFLRALEALETAARTGLEFDPRDEIKARPRKMGSAGAEQVFCIKYLVLSARLAFGRPLHAQVAVIVSVLYDLHGSEEISSIRVSEVTQKKKGGNPAVRI